VYRPLQFHERSQLFIGADDETLSSRCASAIQIVRAVGTHVPSREVCHNGREYWDGTETLKSWGEKSLQSLVTLLRLAASEHQISFNELGRSGVGSGKGTLTKRRNK
jgi:hypothetical protein